MSTVKLFPKDDMDAMITCDRCHTMSIITMRYSRRSLPLPHLFCPMCGDSIQDVSVDDAYTGPDFDRDPAA